MEKKEKKKKKRKEKKIDFPGGNMINLSIYGSFQYRYLTKKVSI